MATTTITFVTLTPSPKKMMAHCCHVLLLKHRKKGTARRLVHCNTTIKKYDAALSSFSSTQTQRKR
jgi:hypothetical protein